MSCRTERPLWSTAPRGSLAPTRPTRASPTLGRVAEVVVVAEQAIGPSVAAIQEPYRQVGEETPASPE